MKAQAVATTRLRTIWWGLCPQCHCSRIFSGSLSMNEECPICHLRFGREPGYFTRAMCVSYALVVPTPVVITAILSNLVVQICSQGAPLLGILTCSGVVLAACSCSVSVFSYHLDPS
jgi:uncharacterized protein (DUF983 family)